MKRILFITALLIFTSSYLSAQTYRLENNQKFGFNAILLNGATIKIRQISTNSEAIKAGDLNGGSLFYERIVRSQFGLSAAFGILRQNIDARVLSVNSSIEQTINTFQLAGRSYFSRHRSRGFNYQVGAELNYFMIESKFIVSNSLITDQTSKADVLTYGIFTGFDWLVKNSGIRFNVGYMFGSSADNSVIDDIHVTYEFNCPYLQLGTFAFF